MSHSLQKMGTEEILPRASTRGLEILRVFSGFNHIFFGLESNMLFLFSSPTPACRQSCVVAIYFLYVTSVNK